MKNIYIVGFMGTGKTVVGRALAQKARVIFVDLDSCIEEKENMTINDIFKAKGEAYFRSIEKETLFNAAQQKGAVISCGGGVVVDPDNMARMKETGICVCLAASPQEILKRIGVTKHRPLLHSGDPLDRIQSLLSSRDSYYRQADILIDTTHLSIEEIAAAILEKLPPEYNNKK
ncbi:MAG: shikimate kinase [Candidatus Omnitrophota bacterium]